MPFNSIFPLTAIDQALWLRATALLRAEEERRKSQELMQILLNSTMASTTTPAAASNLNFRPPLNKHDAGGLQPSKDNARPHLQPPPLPKRRKIQQPQQQQQQQQQQSQQQPQPPQKGMHVYHAKIDYRDIFLKE